MTDIHSHVIPNVDDGSESLEASLQMLRTAAECGTEVIAATPHFARKPGYPKCGVDELEKRFAALCDEAEREELPIKPVRGMEIMASEELPALLSEGEVWTLNGTEYFLVEFSFDEDPDFCSSILHRCIKRGFMPIIAHPERYRFVRREPQIAYEWCRSGYGLQINKGSLLGRFGEGAMLTAMRLISHGLAACVASDAHGAGRRTTDLREVRLLLSGEFGSDYAELLLEHNPNMILSGGELEGFEPYPFI